MRGDELGIAPALAAAIPAAVGLAGQLFGKGGEAGASGKLDIGSILGSVLPALRGAGITPETPIGEVGPQAIRSVVRELLTTIPPPVRTQVLEAIREARGESARGTQAAEGVVKQISEQLLPELTAAIAALKLARDQRQATHEHVTIAKSQERWRANEDAHAAILSKLDAIETRLEAGFRGQPPILRNRRMVNLLGPALVTQAMRGSGA